MTAALDVTLEARESVIERGLNTFVEVGQALAGIRDDRQYRQTHETFEDYCEARWGLSRSRAYELMSAAETALAVSEISDIQPSNEGQAKALRGLEPEQAADTMRLAHDWTDGKPTAQAVKAAREQVAPKRPVAELPESAHLPQDELDALNGALSPPIEPDDEPDIDAEVEPEPKPIPSPAAAAERSPEAQAHRYMHEFYKALSSCDKWLRFDAEKVAEHAEHADLVTVEHHIKSAQTFLDTMRKARSGLRVVNGGKR